MLEPARGGSERHGSWLERGAGAPLEKYMKRLGLLVVSAVLFCLSAFAEKTPIENLYQYSLPNGLNLFVAENHTVPLAYVEIAVRCGAYTQTAENAGLFHLYEHMMFKGNSLFKNTAEVTNALSDLGISNWNGSTDIECVNYYFTIPSSQVKKGLEFWSAAIRSPLLDKNELENEKKVVLSEVQADYSSPERIANYYRAKKIFSDSPWKLDPAGSATVVQNATVKNLKQIQKTFYIPNNSAVFVGGDVNPDEIYALVQTIFGNWKKGKNPFAKLNFSHSKTPFSEPHYAVMPFEKCSKEIAQISVEFRGADLAFDREDSYASDVLNSLLSRPDGIFKRSVMKDGYIGTPSADYISTSYLSRKSCGNIDFAAVVTMPEAELPERAKYFSVQVPELVKEALSGVTEEKIAQTVTRLEDSNIYTNETSTGLLRTMRFWWICADEEYAYTYDEKMAGVRVEDLSRVAEKYIYGKNPFVLVYVNPEVYEESKDLFAEAGFDVASADNAFWFR